MFGKRENTSIRPDLRKEEKTLVGAEAIAQRAAVNKAERNRPIVTRVTEASRMVAQMRAGNRLSR